MPNAVMVTFSRKSPDFKESSVAMERSMLMVNLSWRVGWKILPPMRSFSSVDSLSIHAQWVLGELRKASIV